MASSRRYRLSSWDKGVSSVLAKYAIASAPRDGFTERLQPSLLRRFQTFDRTLARFFHMLDYLGPNDNIVFDS